MKFQLWYFFVGPSTKLNDFSKLHSHYFPRPFGRLGSPRFLSNVNGAFLDMGSHPGPDISPLLVFGRTSLTW